MPHFIVTIHGGNFLIMLDGEQMKMGFYTHRHVEAADPAGAELAAVEKVRGEADLREVTLNLGDPDDPPVLEVEQIYELLGEHVTVDERDMNYGRAWYQMERGPWWKRLFDWKLGCGSPRLDLDGWVLTKR